MTLEPSPELRLVLAPGAPLPEPPVYIKAVLIPAEGEERSIAWGAAPFDETREITVPVPGPGEMKVTWVVERRSAGSSTASTARLDPPQVVTVTRTPGQRIEIQLTAEQLEELLGDR